MCKVRTLPSIASKSVKLLIVPKGRRGMRGMGVGGALLGYHPYLESLPTKNQRKIGEQQRRYVNSSSQSDSIERLRDSRGNWGRL